MAWYRAGTITSSGNIITGVGTKWLDNKMGVGAGQILLVPGDGTVKMYEILDVDTDTRLRLVATPSPALSGAYAIISFYNDSVPDFARRLAAQLAYFQSQMEGWQKIMTGTGNVTIILPDQTSIVMPSFNQMNININNKLSLAGGTMAGGITSTASSAITLRPLDATAYNWIHWTQVDGTAGWRIGRLENNGPFYLRDYSAGGVTALTLRQGDFILTSATAKDTPWSNATLQNGWTVQGGRRCVYRKVFGMVYIEASIIAGTVGAAAFTLPAGYRPAAIQVIPISAGLSSAVVGSFTPRASITTDGVVTILNVPADTYVGFTTCVAIE